MHLHLLTLTNFRQFRERTFKFQPGFNLIVGENGAGKTTTLRGVLAALGNTPQMRRRPRLEDDDIRLSSRTAAIKAVVCYSNDRQEEFQVRKTLWESTRRSARRGKSPLILHYQSNEAVCSAMKTKAIKRVQNVEKDSFRRSEAFLYEAETNASQTTSTENARRFGNSHSVRRFVKRVLATFSSDMNKFYWRFEPYACSLVTAESVADKSLLDEDIQKQARAFAMRWFEEALIRQKKPFIWPDQAKVILTPEGLESRIGDRRLPSLHEIWEDMRVPSSVRELLLSCSLEVKLTPRIMFNRKVGTLSLHQLSDGEQRLFTLFVDIARQLSLNNTENMFGEGEAVILIDEIDVHLHPKWQRRIVPALEDLFPNCQFIATTHSPYVIQATRRDKIISIDPQFSTALDGGNSIEDIAEDIQGVSLPQRSMRAERLNTAAKVYFTLLEKQADDPQLVNSNELRAAEQSYRDASEPFASDPAVHALLKVLAMRGTE